METKRGITFVEALFLMFLGFKIAGVVDWNWWAVFAPLWVWLGVSIVLGIGIGIAKGLVSGRKK